MRSYLISIIIPCYNAEPYLAKCLSSVLQQTYPYWEAICVNDGSKDNTESILQQFAQKESRFKVISQSNAGVSAARNKALSVCEGEYICFVDSDDTIQANFLEALLSLMTNEVELTICNFTRKISTPSAVETVKTTWVNNASDCAKKILLDKTFHPQICCMLFKREVIVQHQLLFFLGCARGEDWEFFMKYLLHISKVAYTSVVLYHYRVNDASAMASLNEKSLTSIGASQRVAAYYEQYNSPVKDTIKQYAVSRTLWKFLILSLLRHNTIIYKQLTQNYNTQEELRKLISYPGKAERISSRLFLISEVTFRWSFYLLGYFHKH